MPSATRVPLLSSERAPVSERCRSNSVHKERVAICLSEHRGRQSRRVGPVHGTAHGGVHEGHHLGLVETVQLNAAEALLLMQSRQASRRGRRTAGAPRCDRSRSRASASAEERPPSVAAAASSPCRPTGGRRGRAPRAVVVPGGCEESDHGGEEQVTLGVGVDCPGWRQTGDPPFQRGHQAGQLRCELLDITAAAGPGESRWRSRSALRRTAGRGWKDPLRSGRRARRPPSWRAARAVTAASVVLPMPASPEMSVTSRPASALTRATAAAIVASSAARPMTWVGGRSPSRPGRGRSMRRRGGRSKEVFGAAAGKP